MELLGVGMGRFAFAFCILLSASAWISLKTSISEQRQADTETLPARIPAAVKTLDDLLEPSFGESLSNGGRLTPRQKSVLMLRNFFDGKIASKAPPVRNLTKAWLTYVMEHEELELMTNEEATKNLCWDGFAPACGPASSHVIRRKSDLLDLWEKAASLEEGERLAAEIEALEKQELQLRLLSCLRGGVPDCTVLNPSAVRPFAATLERQMEEFCAQGHPSYCTAAGEVLERYVSDRPSSKEMRERKNDFYLRGCDNGDMEGCSRGLVEGKLENSERFSDALRRDCEAGEEMSDAFDWERSSSCFSLVSGLKARGFVRQAYETGLAACDREETGLCYSMIEIAAKKKDQETVYRLMKNFCTQKLNPDRGIFGNQTDEETCRKISSSAELTDDIWWLISHQSSTLGYSSQQKQKTIGDLFVE